MNHTGKEHWERIYRDKLPDQLSWWQESPATSLRFIHTFDLPKDAPIIDVGGGDSTLVDRLLNEGFENITVLDISELALQRVRRRLGEDASRRVHWVVSDVLDYRSEAMFEIWHDRAAFHFLTANKDISSYAAIARQSVREGGHLILATFSTVGPKSCSGLPVHRYDETTLSTELRTGFEKITCVAENHMTPFNTMQNFLYCSFRRRAGA